PLRKDTGTASDVELDRLNVPRSPQRIADAPNLFCFDRTVAAAAWKLPARTGCCDPRYFLQMKLESGLKEGPDDEAIEVHGRADHCGAARAGGRAFDRRGVPQARDQHGDVLRLEGQVWRDGSLRGQAAQAA